MSFISIADNLLLNSSSGLVEVESLGFHSPSFIPDLIVITKKPMANGHPCTGMDKEHLCGDEVFLSSVIGHLRTLGYQGESFGRGERGAQSDYEVSMEPGSDFNQFAKSFGWKKSRMPFP